MKKNVLSFLLILFSLTAFAQNHTKKDLVGQWKGSDKQNVMASIHFLDTDKLIVAIGPNTMPPYTYKVDLRKSPAKLDITMLTPDGKSATLQGFLWFVDNNTIKWQIFPDGNRPATFKETPNNPIITLKRVK